MDSDIPPGGSEDEASWDLGAEREKSHYAHSLTCWISITLLDLHQGES